MPIAKYVLVVFAGLVSSFCLAQQNTAVRIQSHWVASEVNEPSCAMLQARLRQTGMTMQQIQNEQTEILAIAGGHRAADLAEIFLRDHVPLDLNVNVTLEVDLNFASAVQTSAGWQIKSSFVNWVQPAVPTQNLPSYFRFSFPNAHDVHLEVDMPLLQACMGENDLWLQIQNSEPLKITAPSVEAL